MKLSTENRKRAGAFLKAKRQGCFVSAQFIADMLVVKRTTVFRWEAGIRVPYRRYLSRLYEILELTPLDVLQLQRLWYGLPQFPDPPTDLSPELLNKYGWD